MQRQSAGSWRRASAPRAGAELLQPAPIGRGVNHKVLPPFVMKSSGVLLK